ncbi:unnamed protein product [Owenia fusiformis]|uniref:Uncharacterized protein n=1 Tax=Owenia fusiformis TaxID=6347 RepID=A0A8S4NYS6_OWEFU|nr:unnamed protein product [Owenia fusiformis]
MDTLLLLLVGLFATCCSAGNPKLLEKMFIACGGPSYLYVQEDPVVLKACKGAREGYEAEFGKQLKWDANTYIKSGLDYAMKIRVKTMASGKEAFIHILVSADGEYIRSQEGFFKKKDCIEIPMADDPLGLIFLDKMNRDCSRLTPPRDYSYVKDYPDVLQLAKSARAQYEALGYGDTLKWDSNTFVNIGSDYYGVKIRVKRMNDSKIAFVHVLVNASGFVDVQPGEFTKRDCIDIPEPTSVERPVGGEEQQTTEGTPPITETTEGTPPITETTEGTPPITETTEGTPPITETTEAITPGSQITLPTSDFSRELTERCDRDYYKVAGDLWDTIKGLKTEIGAILGIDTDLFQPRIYIQEGDDKYVKIRVRDFENDAGQRYIHVHVDADGNYVGLLDNKKRKSCIEVV